MELLKRALNGEFEEKEKPVYKHVQKKKYSKNHVSNPERRKPIIDKHSSNKITTLIKSSKMDNLGELCDMDELNHVLEVWSADDPRRFDIISAIMEDFSNGKSPLRASIIKRYSKQFDITPEEARIFVDVAKVFLKNSLKDHSVHVSIGIERFYNQIERLTQIAKEGKNIQERMKAENLLFRANKWFCEWLDAKDNAKNEPMININAQNVTVSDLAEKLKSAVNPDDEIIDAEYDDYIHEPDEE